MAKRILCTVTNDLNYDQRMQRICSTLQAAGYEVCLVGRKRKNSRPLSEQAFEQVRLNILAENGFIFYAEYNIRLFAYLLRNPFDAVCSVDFDTLPAGCLASLFKRKKRVFDAHEYFTETPEVVHRPLVRGFWALVGRICLPFYRYAYTVGPSLAELFSTQHRPTFAVVRNVPFLEKATRNKTIANPKTILYQGALNEGRGIETAIRAMKHLPEGIELHLAGEGDLSEELRALVKQNRLESKVKFLGFVRPNDLKKLTQNAWLGLNLLENKGLSYYFSLANKFFDYMQAGVPSVNMDFPEYREIIMEHPCGLLLEDLDPIYLSRLIQELLVDEERYKAMQEAASEAAAIFHWDNEKKVLLEVWGNVFAP